MFLKLYIIALPIFMACDLLWLGVLAKKFYHAQIGFMMKPDVNWAAAIIFYLLFVAGLVIFVLIPAHEKKSLAYSIIYGALFGLVTYATFDLTNLAVIKGWNFTVTIVDIVYGTILGALVSGITYYISLKNYR